MLNYKNLIKSNTKVDNFSRPRSCTPPPQDLEGHSPTFNKITQKYIPCPDRLSVSLALRQSYGYPIYPQEIGYHGAIPSDSTPFTTLRCTSGCTAYNLGALLYFRPLLFSMIFCCPQAQSPQHRCQVYLPAPLRSAKDDSVVVWGPAKEG